MQCGWEGCTVSARICADQQYETRGQTPESGVVYHEAQYGWFKNRNEGQGRGGMWVGKGRCQCEASAAAAARTLGGRIDRSRLPTSIHDRVPGKGLFHRSCTRPGLGRCLVRSGGRGWSRALVGMRNPSEAPSRPAHSIRSIPCLVTREKPVSCWTVQSCERRAST